MTKYWIGRFESSIQYIYKLRVQKKYKPEVLDLQERAENAILNDLQEQIREYEELKAGKFNLSILDKVKSIPENMVKARISLGWTQKDLADKIGTTEQQIQKYESTNYQSASLKRINEITEAFQEYAKHRKEHKKSRSHQ